MKDSISNRLVFLAEQFNIFTVDEVDIFIGEAELDDVNISLINGRSGYILAIIKSTLINSEKNRYRTTIHISDNLFANMVNADPTENKEYLQWMLTIFRNMVKEPKTREKAIQFAEEDLKLANKYLNLFSKNKKKKRFKELCESGFGIPKTDPTNINQYSSLSQLFDAVDPFIEREPSTLERAIQRFVDCGQGKIGFRDRKWTVYIPLTKSANCVMEQFASWCTAQPNSGMFKTYTQNYKLPNGSKSNIYIIINNDLFNGKTDECYQIHFESKQIRGRTNGDNINIYEPVLSKSEGIKEYFKNELLNLSKLCKEKSSNIYMDYLVSFGFSEVRFEVIKDDVPIIKFINTDIPVLPDISRFKDLDELILVNTNLYEIDKSIGTLSNLVLLSVPNNKLKELPKEIGNLKKLEIINIMGNNITNIPDEIKFLDKSCGGNLYRISIDSNNIGRVTYNRLKELLPNTIIDCN